MPPMSSVESTRSGSSGSDRAKDRSRRVSAAARVAPFHRIVEVHHHFATGAVQSAKRKIDAADDDREHVVEVVRDAAGQLPDRLHLLDLAKLRLRGLALGRLGLQCLVRLPELLRPLADREFEILGALGLALGQLSRERVLAKRRDRHDSKEDRAETDEDPEPAQIIGELVRLVGEKLALLDLVAHRLRARP